MYLHFYRSVTCSCLDVCVWFALNLHAPSLTYELKRERTVSLIPPGSSGKEGCFFFFAIWVKPFKHIIPCLVISSPSASPRGGFSKRFPRLLRRGWMEFLKQLYFFAFFFLLLFLTVKEDCGPPCILHASLSSPSCSLFPQLFLCPLLLLSNPVHSLSHFLFLPFFLSFPCSFFLSRMHASDGPH